MSLTVLVVGATGATGKHVVQKLLDEGHTVKVIVRSQERMMGLLSSPVPEGRLTVTEASLLDMSSEDIKAQVSNADAVVSCLGHNLTFKGIYGHPQKLVAESVKVLSQALIATVKDADKKTPKKLILMGSDGVAHPQGTDETRPFSERLIISIIRALIPPHRDNELAADFLVNLGCDNDACPSVEWVVVRPTDLIDDGPPDQYDLFPKPVGSLFGGGEATRSNVARAMVDLLTQNDLWSKWVYQMPVLHDKKETAKEPDAAK